MYNTLVFVQEKDPKATLSQDIGKGEHTANWMLEQTRLMPAQIDPEEKDQESWGLGNRSQSRCRCQGYSLIALSSTDQS